MDFEVVDPRFNDVVDTSQQRKTLAEGFQFTEGPIWHPYDRHVTFSDIPADSMHRWSPEDGVSAYRSPSHNANGNTYDKQAESSPASTPQVEWFGRNTMVPFRFWRRIGTERNSTAPTTSSCAQMATFSLRIRHLGVDQESASSVHWISTSEVSTRSMGRRASYRSSQKTSFNPMDWLSVWTSRCFWLPILPKCIYANSPVPKMAA